ncbi:MAG TPA: hypothetical protein VFX59_20235, partial [Polyangiales bacterium]|nr:hypothetical protein [Polyangiales bacterium]
GERFELPRLFYRQAARIVEGPWSMSTGADLRYPEVDGPRSAVGNLMNVYFARLVRAASKHPPTARRVLRVLQLVDPPSALLRPAALTRALLDGAAPRTAPRLPRALTISGVR